MQKKSLKVLLAVVSMLVLVGATATAQTQYQEAPMLSELVEQGELPPVAERLPEEPVVVTPVEEIGTYGGTLQGLRIEQPNWGLGKDLSQSRHALLNNDDQFTIVKEGIVKDWEFSEDYKELTIYLREGMKWSDGAPLTADDYLFAWKDIQNNKELNPVPTDWEGVEFEKLDNYSFKYTFPEPQPQFWRDWGQRRDEWMGDIVAPAHYAKTLHIDYNPDANQQARAAGFQNWPQMFTSMVEQRFWTNPDLPVLDPWVLKELTPSLTVWERNPYYWKVDTEGNQLPYIDRIVDTPAVDVQLRSAKVLSGEPDLYARGLELSLYPELRNRAEELNYDVWLIPDLAGAQLFLAPNKTYQDLKYAELFRDLEFRQAMSLAINREEINESIYLGQGVPQQAAPPPTDIAMYNEELANYFAEFDPERANQLLDEIGLDERGAQGYRTFPDGSDLTLRIDVAPTFPDHPQAAELMAAQLKEVGLNTTVNVQSYESILEGNLNGTTMIPTWIMVGNTANDAARGSIRSELVHGWMDAAPWNEWLESNGQQGEKPPEEFWSYVERRRALQALRLNPDSEENLEKAKEVIDEAVREVNIIGTVAAVPLVVVARDTLRNIPKDLNPQAPGWGAMIVWRPWQLFLEGQE